MTIVERKWIDELDKMDIPRDVVRSYIYPYLSIIDVIKVSKNQKIKLAPQELGAMFVERCREYLGELFDAICETIVEYKDMQMVMTGSFVLKMITNAEFSAGDIDLFCIQGKDKKSLFNTGEQEYSNEPGYIDKYCGGCYDVYRNTYGDIFSTIYNADVKDKNIPIKRIQTISLSECQLSIQQYIYNHFDFPCCMAIFDGCNLVISEECYQACINRSFRVEYNIARAYTTSRLYKYTQRGYEIKIQLDGRIFTMPAYVKTNIDRRRENIKKNYHTFMEYAKDFINKFQLTRFGDGTELKELPTTDKLKECSVHRMGGYHIAEVIEEMFKLELFSCSKMESQYRWRFYMHHPGNIAKSFLTELSFNSLRVSDPKIEKTEIDMAIAFQKLMIYYDIICKYCLE